ncbi:AsnC family transcriptional regulator [Candidatus Micrarchaeota archaeon]|nr:AsnC family transcriptional regulator [Candidatus Micrarchaeota archaeon]
MVDQPEKLDKLDMQILHQLDIDGFQSLSQIGKKLKTGRDVMHYRVKRLEERGVIKKYISILDYGKIGYFLAALYLKFRHTNPDLEKEIIEYYKSRPEVWWLDGMEGQYDLAVGWFAKDVPALKKLQRDLMNNYRKHIQEYKFRFFNNFYHFKRNYLSEKVQPSEFDVIAAENKKITDETDDSILKILSENARMPYVEIANQLNLSAAQVHYRIKELKRKRVILGARPQLDLKKLGYDWYKLDIYLDDYSVYDQLIKFVSTHPNVIYAYDVFGGADLELDLEVKNYEEFKQLEDSIKSKFSKSIEKTDFIIFTKEHKLVYFPQI